MILAAENTMEQELGRRRILNQDNNQDTGNDVHSEPGRDSERWNKGREPGSTWEAGWGGRLVNGGGERCQADLPLIRRRTRIMRENGSQRAGLWRNEPVLWSWEVSWLLYVSFSFMMLPRSAIRTPESRVQKPPISANQNASVSLQGSQWGPREILKIFLSFLVVIQDFNILRF